MNLRSFGARYILIVGITLFLFINFIACGSQLYQVSMKDDFDDDKAPAESKDNTSTLFGIHASNGWDRLPIDYRFDMNMNGEQKKALQAAMGTWEKIVGKKLFKFNGIHSGVTGDSFKDLYGSLSDGINGHYLDANWKKTGKPDVVLATTIWDNASGDTSMIARSDIRFNEQNYLIGDSLKLAASETKEVVDMQSLALHELGHLLGLTHVEPKDDSLSVMNPHLFIGEGLTTRVVSLGDIKRIQQIYGCDGSSCDNDALYESLQKAGSEVAH